MLPPTLVKVTIVNGRAKRANPFPVGADDLAQATTIAQACVAREPYFGDLAEYVSFGQVLLVGVLLGQLHLVTVRMRIAVLGLLVHAHCI